jgi:malonate transporter and related proteins
VVVIFIASAAAPFFYSNRRDQGAFIQGSFKGNIAILGLGLAFTLYGDRGIAHAAVIMVFLVPFANIMAVLILTAYSDEGDSLPVKQLVFKVISNPVILAVLLGLPFSLIPMKVPAVAETTVNYFARLMLPLALFTMGTGLEIEEIKKGMVPAAAASFLKIIVMPAAALVFCLVFHVEKEGMGIIISITGVPSGISSYILATAFNSNHELASHILIISTFAALGTLSLGLAILMNFGMI